MLNFNLEFEKSINIKAASVNTFVFSVRQVEQKNFSFGNPTYTDIQKELCDKQIYYKNT